MQLGVPHNSCPALEAARRTGGWPRQWSPGGPGQSGCSGRFPPTRGVSAGSAPPLSLESLQARTHPSSYGAETFVLLVFKEHFWHCQCWSNWSLLWSGSEVDSALLCPVLFKDHDYHFWNVTCKCYIITLSVFPSVKSCGSSSKNATV